MKPQPSEVGHSYYLLVNKTLCGPQRGEGRYLGENKPNRACWSLSWLAFPCTIVVRSRNAICRSACFHTRKKIKQNRTERSGSGDPLPPETKLVTEARSSIHLPSRWSRYGSFFPGSELTPTAQWSRITLGHHTHTRTFKHDPDYFPNSMQSMQTHTVFRGGSNPGSTMGDFVWGWAVQRKFCVGAIRREDPDLWDGSPFTGSAASLPALPDFVRVRADAFPQSAGEAAVLRIARKAPVHSSTKKQVLSTGTELQGTFMFGKVQG